MFLYPSSNLHMDRVRAYTFTHASVSSMGALGNKNGNKNIYGAQVNAHPTLAKLVIIENFQLQDLRTDNTITTPLQRSCCNPKLLEI